MKSSILQPHARVLIGLLALTAWGCQTGPLTDSPYAHNSYYEDEVFAAGANRPAGPRLLFATARLLAAQGRDPEAKYLFERLIDQHPSFLPAYSELALTQVRHNRIDRAIETLSRGLQVAPDDPVLHNNMGMCLALDGEYHQAFDHFQYAADLAPDVPRYQANVAFALGMLGRYDESFAAYRRVLPPAESHYNLAVLCEAREDATRAGIERQRAVELGLVESSR